LETRLAPPKSIGHFEATLVHTMVLLGSSPEEVQGTTEQKGAGKKGKKGKGSQHGKGGKRGKGKH